MVNFLQAGDPDVKSQSGHTASQTFRALKRIGRVFHKQVIKNWPLPCIENYGICCRNISMIIGDIFIDNVNNGCQALQKE
jgi:hypothetical protein